jgi:two-component system sensor histidine kinase/response regulator
MSFSPELNEDSADTSNTWDSLLQLKPVNPVNTSVLLVDDDPDQLRYLSYLVSRAGYRVTASSTVADALALLSQRPFQILISDLKMPDMNGFEFLKAVRALERPDAVRPIPVIVLTGAEGDVEFAAIEQGADMFCEKFRVQTLLPKQIQFLLEE